MVRKILNTLLRYTLRITKGLIATIIIYIVIAIVLSVIPVNNSHKSDNDIAVYINTNGVHTDIIVPVKSQIKDWSNTILYTHTKATDSSAAYLAFGWGDKDFYLNTPHWSNLKSGTVFRAAFYLGTSAMHTKYYRTIEENDECIKITISKEDYTGLVKYISESFKRNDDDSVQWIAESGYGSYDTFYNAERKYNLFYTCNTWANNALKAANQKAALWTPSDKGIFYHYR